MCHIPYISSFLVDGTGYKPSFIISHISGIRAYETIFFKAGLRNVRQEEKTGISQGSMEKPLKSAIGSAIITACLYAHMQR